VAHNPFMVGVDPDPLPWLTSRFNDAGVFDPDILPEEYMARVLGVCQSTVNAMSDHDRTFVVRYTSAHGTAYTDGRKQEVVVGTKPVTDKSLTPGQQAAIVLALATHEVGHVRWSVTLMDRIQKHYVEGTFKAQWAARIFNVIHDIHLEHWQMVDYPSVAPALTLKGLYFARPWVLDLRRNVTRYGALINATLYPHATDWTSPEGAEFKAWADGWAERAKAKGARSLKGVCALIDEALDYLRYDESSDVPPPEKPPEGPPEDDEDGGEDESTDESEPGEGEDEGEDAESDDDGESDDGESDGDESDGDESDGDESDGEGGSSGPPESDTPEDDEGSGEGSGEGDDESDDEGDPAKGDSDGGDRTIGGEGDHIPEQPLPSIHGEMHSKVDGIWQDRVNAHLRMKATGRDRQVVGGGDFHKREVRILRIHG
jgi:hypothetical protein